MMTTLEKYMRKGFASRGTEYEKQTAQEQANISRTVLKLIILFIITLTVLAWRRPDQLLHPYIWVEEGVVTLPAFIKNGWSSLFSPVSGYLVLPAKLIFLLAASISFDHLVVIEYWLTVFFTFGVLVTVAFSPTYLKLPFFCAIAALMIPSDAEVFAVSEYAFWWGSLFAVVALLWEPDTQLIWRCVLMILGGLSSPLIVPITALMGIKTLWLRRRSDVMVLIIALLSTAIQLIIMKQQKANVHVDLLAINWELVVSKFFGMYVSSWQPFIFGCLIVALLGVKIVLEKKFALLLIIGCLVSSIFITISRVPVEAIHPQLAGPRYFFFPYIFLTWTLLYVFDRSTILQRTVISVLIILSLYQFAKIGQRHHIAISWETNMAACKTSDEYTLPVHSDGSENMWYVKISGKDCQRLSRQSLFS